MKNTTSLALVLSLVGTMTWAAGPDTDGDGVPDTAEPLLHTDPGNPDTDGDGQNDLADAAPVTAPDPTVSGGAAAPFHIGEALAENNFDPVAKADAADHLELQLVNDTATDVTGLTVFYTFTDVDTGEAEAYAASLGALTIPANGELRVHFDDTGLPGHLRANPNSIYVTSQAAKHVTVSVQAAGYQPVVLGIEKDAGGAEKAD
jgi:hypothetical protein